MIKINKKEAFRIALAFRELSIWTALTKVEVDIVKKIGGEYPDIAPKIESLYKK